MHEIKKMLKEELKKYEGKGISAGSLDVMHKLTDTIKNIYEIETLESGGSYSEMREGYSRDGDWEARGSYDGGNSYARRGTHYVRGHYSRDGSDYSRDGGSSYRDGAQGSLSYRGGYSRDSAKEEMMDRLEEAMERAETDKERESIKRCIMHLNNF